MPTNAANPQASMIAQGLIKMGHPTFPAIATAAAAPNSTGEPSCQCQGQALDQEPPPDIAGTSADSDPQADFTDVRLRKPA